jgi:hypothetical protein
MTYSNCRCGVDYHAPILQHLDICDVWDQVDRHQAERWGSK